MAEQPTRYALVAAIVVRGAALCNLMAFASYGSQIDGLNGANGILPAGTDDPTIAHLPLRAKLWASPSLWWLHPTDGTLHGLCVVGAVAAFTALLGVSPAAGLLVCWACYLSLASVAGDFMNLQWDTLLIEATFATVWLASWRPRPALVEPSPIAVLAVRFLAFRLMWMSGIVKLRSGDPTWADLTALTYHYWTQPLPNPLSPVMAALSPAFHRLSCEVMFAIELVAPFLLFGPREARRIAFAGFALLLGMLFATGNYGFFQLLSIIVCLSALDDALLRHLLALLQRRAPPLTPILALVPVAEPAPARLLATAASAALIAVGALRLTSQLVGRDHLLPAATELLAETGPFRTVNGYGLFATMTTQRPELIFEGSDDGVVWKPYELPYKPGDIDRGLPIVAPYMPRLDWQLWFAALGRCGSHPWVINAMQGLHDGDPAVLALFGTDPFPDHPPAQVRVQRYLYTFTGGEVPAGAEVGEVWTRKLVTAAYCPTVGG